jgi:hypothetical protein
MSQNDPFGANMNRHPFSHGCAGECKCHTLRPHKSSMRILGLWFSVGKLDLSADSHEQQAACQHSAVVILDCPALVLACGNSKAPGAMALFESLVIKEQLLAITVLLCNVSEGRLQPCHPSHVELSQDDWRCTRQTTGLHTTYKHMRHTYCAAPAVL